MQRRQIVTPIYLGAGTALALARIAMFLWLNYGSGAHMGTQTATLVEWALYPEAFLSMHTWIGHIANQGVFSFLFASLLVLGSFVLASPLLLLGCRVKPAETRRNEGAQRVDG